MPTCEGTCSGVCIGWVQIGPWEFWNMNISHIEAAEWQLSFKHVFQLLGWLKSNYRKQVSSNSAWLTEGFTLALHRVRCSTENKQETEIFTNYVRANWFFTSQLSKLCYYSVVFYWSGHSGAKNRGAKTAKTKFELAVGNTNFEETQHSKADIQFAPSWTRHYSGTADLDSLHQVDPIYSVFDVPNSTATATTDWDLQPAIFIGQWQHSKVRRFKTVRSARCNAAFNFLLWRLSRYISEPFHTRAQQQMCLALCFDDTSPPTNMPMRISCPDDTFQLQIREWLLGFTHFRRHLFPPLHKPKAPFVHVKRRTWGQSLFNFQKWLQWWHSDDILPCACKQFPDHIQNQSRDLPHIAAWAAECYPDIPQLRLHIATAQPSTWTFFVPGNRGIWKMATSMPLATTFATVLATFSSATMGRVLATPSWTFECSSDMGTTSPIQGNTRRSFPHSLLLICPKFWQDLMRQTFLQPEVFAPCFQPAEDIRRNFKLDMPQWIRDEYRWGFDCQARLSTACMLPKPTRWFRKARPIVDYSRSWILKLGTALSVVLLEISKSFTCCFNTMSLTAAQQIFKQTSVEEELDVLQQDIAGFDNQVSHDRIVLVYSMSFQVFSKNNDVHKTK